ncbi:hypothetical protein KKF34_05725 [Myxococcota bacterium]|nr:hypothetical protein [Myxococcota bacterium]MBU1496361.1 hypothetical protein [Myxococcota bacterium]
MSSDAEAYLLAVDLGLKTGLALFDNRGTLLWYRSHNVGSRANLKRAVHTILRQLTSLKYIYVEGDRALGEIWKKEGTKVGATLTFVSPETWREVFMYERQMEDSKTAKETAVKMATRAVALLSPNKSPIPLRHDTAEAILLGVYAIYKEGWLETIPDFG